ncbi:MAG: DUF3179 domain-containing (seleno)protein [Candidatus Zipacnadales bacterium]
MSRRGGLLILLVSIVISVVLTWALRMPVASRSAMPLSVHERGSPGRIVPSPAKPATIRNNRFVGGHELAPQGFDATVTAVPRNEILDVGLSPDDLPPLENPPTVRGSCSVPSDGEIVLGIVMDGHPRAYPLAILNYHWAVNDIVEGRAVVVLWDPLSQAAAVYHGQLDRQPLRVGASGKFYQGSALFYDRESTSLFPVITGRFVTGPLTNRRLQPLPYRRETWATWRDRHPDTEVVSYNTAFERDYRTDPFMYASVPEAGTGRVDTRLLVPPRRLESPLRLAPTTLVIGFVEPGGKPCCCDIDKLPTGGEPLRLGTALIVRQDKRLAHVTTSGGVWPPQTVCYYYAWVGLYPETEVWPALHTVR